jgi:hypothetical protein
MKDLKLLTIAFVMFVALPLSVRTIQPRPYQLHRVELKDKQLLQTDKKKTKQIAMCYSINRFCFWDHSFCMELEIPYRCSGDGYGGGGGNGF